MTSSGPAEVTVASESLSLGVDRTSRPCHSQGMPATTYRLAAGVNDSVWLIVPTVNLRSLVLRHYPQYRYVNTWTDVNGHGVHLAHPQNWAGNRRPPTTVTLDPRRLP